jgi:hypothetical protein
MNDLRLAFQCSLDGTQLKSIVFHSSGTPAARLFSLNKTARLTFALCVLQLVTPGGGITKLSIETHRTFIRNIRQQVNGRNRFFAGLLSTTARSALFLLHFSLLSISLLLLLLLLIVSRQCLFCARPATAGRQSRKGIPKTLFFQMASLFFLRSFFFFFSSSERQFSIYLP